MTPTIIVFASSLCVSAILLLFKAIEIKYGKRSIFSALLQKLDSKSAAFIAAVKFRCLQIIQTVRYIILVRSKEFIASLLHKLLEKIAVEYHARQSAILMGRRELVGSGSASFYLKKITEHKGNEKKGKIEESF